MRHQRTIQEYLEDVLDRLENSNFDLEQNVPWEGKTFWWTAQACDYLGLRQGYREYFFLFAGFGSLDWELLQDYSHAAYRFACEHRDSGSPVGWYCSIWCFPVALVDRLNDRVVEEIRHRDPAKHWGSFEMPCVYEAESDALHYFERSPVWGLVHYSKLRQLIRNLLGTD
jgi:hypothetical protein